ncbi:hypothetical protein FPQ18DRAFT_310769 [Pyronema domesticum]|nr:hypothetical protein FPQ18DRAFT_310769 [Pyronema domesticum]
MTISDWTPVLDPTDVYSTTLPQNLQTTDPFISALANYRTGIQTLFANLAEMKANMKRTGYGRDESSLKCMDIMAKNSMNVQEAAMSEEAKDIWVRLFGKLGFLQKLRYIVSLISSDGDWL